MQMYRELNDRKEDGENVGCCVIQATGLVDGCYELPVILSLRRKA